MRRRDTTHTDTHINTTSIKSQLRNFQLEFCISICSLIVILILFEKDIFNMDKQYLKIFLFPDLVILLLLEIYKFTKKVNN